MKRIVSTIFFSIAAIVLPQVASAQVALLPVCYDLGDCTSCDFIQLFVNVTKLVLSVISAAALLTFIIGGFMWIISGGSSERVQQGKKIMVGTVVGVFITLGGYFIVNLTIAAFVGADFGRATLFGAEWDQYCEAPKGANDCTDKADGTVCSTTDCSENCLCLNQACTTGCEYTLITDFGHTAECVVNEDACQYIVYDTTGGFCPSSTPVCCAKPSN